MKFGECALDAALGAVLAHSVPLPGGGKLAKGLVIDAAAQEALRAAGHRRIVVAQLEPGDIGEDEAARRLAAALAEGCDLWQLSAPHAGRVNLSAGQAGVVRFDPARLHGLNRINPAITLASVPAWQRCVRGTLAATIKIITYAVSAEDLARAEVEARHAGFRLCPVTAESASLILSQAPGEAADKLAAKAREASQRRLRALGIRLAEVIEVRHDRDAIAAALAGASGDLVLLLTGAATSDLMDTAPSALRQAGGTVLRFGMPVDPGNLLFHGLLAGRPVIGLPGCARSSALNGADWVLERAACGIAIDDEMIATMGVGGLLKEIPMRPAPRQERA